jgi:MOSC domain-containing protein YiiM
MKSKILSLNIGLPQTVEWDGKTIETSMVKKSVEAIDVRFADINGDRFANTKHHGTPDAVLYAYGVDAISDFVSLLARPALKYGEIGENLTLDRLDETEISVGDIFQIGEVVAQATFPRIPCTKINFCLQDRRGQKAMIQSKRSGIYFRILTPGKITLASSFERIEKAKAVFTISEVYERMVGGVKVSAEDLARVRANGAFPEARIAQWLSVAP